MKNLWIGLMIGLLSGALLTSVCFLIWSPAQSPVVALQNEITTLPVPTEIAPPTPPSNPPKIAPAKTENLQVASKALPNPGRGDGFPPPDDKTSQAMQRAHKKLESNQPEAAIEEIENAFKNDAANPHLAIELALMQARIAKNVGRSEEILSDFLKRNPESKMASAAYADYLVHHGREAEATPYFLKAASGGNHAESQAQLAHHYRRSRDSERALDAYQTAFALNEKALAQKSAAGESDALAKQTLGMSAIDLADLYVSQGNLVEARRYAQTANGLVASDVPELRTLNEKLRTAVSTQNE